RLVNSPRFLYSSFTTFFHFCGAMVQRLARGPFKAKMRVRFPLALPSLGAICRCRRVALTCTTAGAPWRRRLAHRRLGVHAGPNLHAVFFFHAPRIAPIKHSPTSG